MSYAFDDYLNVHSRMQLVQSLSGPKEAVLIDPRMAIARGSPDDTPYGAVETMTNARPGSPCRLDSPDLLQQRAILNPTNNFAQEWWSTSTP